jgi:hypothetical protein
VLAFAQGVSLDEVTGEMDWRSDGNSLEALCNGSNRRLDNELNPDVSDLAQTSKFSSLTNRQVLPLQRVTYSPDFTIDSSHPRVKQGLLYDFARQRHFLSSERGVFSGASERVSYPITNSIPVHIFAINSNQ